MSQKVPEFGTTSNPFSNFAEVLTCIGGNSCAMGLDVDSGFMGAIIFFFTPLVVLPFLAIRSHWPEGQRTLFSFALAGLLFWLCFGYAVPLMWGITNYIGWALAVPIVTYLLLIGPAAIAGICFVAVTSVRSPGRWLPESKMERSLLFVFVVATLVAWRHLYITYPEVAIDPDDRQQPWLDYLLSIWPTAIAIISVWWLAKLFTSIAAIVTFGTLAVLTVVLDSPEPSQRSLSLPAIASSSVSTITALTITPVITIVIAMLATAAVSLVLVFAFAYIMTMALVIIAMAMLVGAIIKRD